MRSDKGSGILSRGEEASENAAPGTALPLLLCGMAH